MAAVIVTTRKCEDGRVRIFARAGLLACGKCCRMRETAYLHACPACRMRAVVCRNCRFLLEMVEELLR